VLFRVGAEWYSYACSLRNNHAHKYGALPGVLRARGVFLTLAQVLRQSHNPCTLASDAVMSAGERRFH
jgi:hypothetical protein